MRKFAAIALALILAMSSMFATVAAAAPGDIESNFAFKGFDIVEGSGVVVDVENMRIYGLRPLLKTEDLDEYLIPGDGYDMTFANMPEGGFIGTGTQIILKDKDGVPHPFDVIIFGDVTGDGVYDVIDLAQSALYANEQDVPDELDTLAVDGNNDGVIKVDDYSEIVNAVVGEKTVSQNGTGTEEESVVEIDDQVFTGADEPVVTIDDVTLTFNNGVIDSKHYEVVGDGEYDYIEEDGELYGVITVKGTGLFAGEATIKFKVVSLLEKIVATVNEVIADANLKDVVSVDRVVTGDVTDITVNVNASNIIRGNFDVDMAGLNGLLTKIEEFKAEYLQEVDLTVGDLAIATNGDFDRGAIKALVFDIAKGIFCDIANAADNTVKSYSGALVTNDKIADLTEKFNVDVVMTGNGYDIDRVKAFAAKISRYVAFDVVDGNAVVDITMPAGFATKVVDILGQGDVETATAAFNDMLVYHAVGDYLAKVTAEDISAGSVDEINQAINVAALLGDLVNKALGEVADATVTSNVETMPLLSGLPFDLDETNENKFGALVGAFANMLSTEVLTTKIGDFYNDGIYTVKADVEVDYRNIKETVIVNLDLFGAVETPSIIEETATYFSGIIADLGLSNAVAVSYDADNCRALATLDAREFVTNFSVDENAFDGLYTDIKGYFDETYGTATIVVDGNEIVTNGKINKSALKNLIFSAATGFFQDAANLGANNVLRSLNTVVTEADGTVHSFDLDFALVGSNADINRVASIAAKVADYVSFDVVDGNAVVNVGVPAGMRAKIIDLLGQGDAEAAQAAFNSLQVYNALSSYVAKVKPEDISASSADEIQAIIDMVAKVDSVINKVIGKVESGVAYDANGNAYALLSGESFVIADNTMEAVVSAFASQLSEGILLSNIGNFMNEDGVYTIKCDVALSIGGIKETVVLNLDVFGDYEKKTAIDETVDYVEDIFADLGVSSFASVELTDGKAVATFNATELLADGLKSFNEEALDGLYTDIKDYFYANFGDSTITVGDYELVTDGKINKAVVKDLLFDFATGFFTDVANMDANTIRSYNTVVVDGDGNVEEFAFDFNLGGKEAHIEKLQTISAKVAELVSFSEVNGNAAVAVSVPAGMKTKVVDILSHGTGDVAAAQEEFNKLSVYSALTGYVANVKPEDISKTYAKDIQTAINMVADMSSVIGKVISKVESGVAYDANGKAYALLSGVDFAIADNTVEALVSAFATQLSADLLLNAKMSDFMNADGSYTISCDVQVKGIKETVTLTIDLF